MQKRILIVDDDINIVSILGNIFTTILRGYLVLTATSANQGLNMLKTQEPDVVILDVRLGDRSGMDLLKDFYGYLDSQRVQAKPRFIVITAYPDQEIRKKALEYHEVDAFLMKPFTEAEILYRVVQSLRHITKREDQALESLERQFKKRVDNRSEEERTDKSKLVDQKLKEGSQRFRKDVKMDKSGSKRRRCVLVLDDNKALVDSIEVLLKPCGFEVVKATDTMRALQLSNEIVPDVVIADLQMPKLEGIPFLEKFKRLQPTVKVIVMTGYLSEYKEKIKSAQETGLVDAVIEKPFPALAIEKLVYQVLKSPEEEINFHVHSKGKILIVDDESEICDLFKDIFRHENYSATSVLTAEEAATVYQNFNPDVVLTDIKMPGQDGIWLIKKIQTWNKNAKIIVITGQDSKPVLDRLKDETGITTYFTKPLSSIVIGELLTMVRSMIKGAENDS